MTRDDQPCCAPGRCAPEPDPHDRSAPATDATLPPDQLRDRVREGYAEIAKTGQWSGVRPASALAQAAGGCCEPSQGGGGCCGPASLTPEQVAMAVGYAEADLKTLPEGANLGLSCGTPTALASLQPGEVVLDLGSGGGFDCFLAGPRVGATGRVIGVDMTPEMIALSRKNTGKVGATNVEFRLGEIEHLPIDSESVDVIISNCVINLSPDKDQVFREAFRVLRPGGRLQVSDMVWTKSAPDEVKNDMEKWAGCIAGALLESDYLGKIAAAGFHDITSVTSEYPDGRGIASAAIVAFKR